jgi:hypothetical protein
MDIEIAIIMFVLLMVNTWWNYRQGYKRGAVGGHLVGVHETVEFLMERNYLDATNVSTEKPATVEEMTVYFVKTLHQRRVQNMERAVQD